MNGMLRLLLAEDSESDAELVVRLLRNAGYDVVFERVQDACAMRAALADSAWDLIICDYRMPGFDAPAALALLHETGRDIPFLVVSGTIGEDVAVAMMKAGAHDYLMKSNLARLAAAVAREVREAAARAERRVALQRLHDSEAQLALAIESTDMGVFDFDPQTGKVFYSDLTRRHLDLPPGVEPTLANFLESLHPADRPRVERAVNDALRPENSGRYAQEYRTRALVKGEEHWISAWGRVLFDEQGKPFRFLGVVRDITEKKRAERDLQFQLQLTACITEQSTDCILLVDLAGALRFLNPEAERVFGYTLEQFRDKTPHELLHHHYPNGRPFPGSECKLSRHMASGELLRDYEDVFFTRNGTPIDMAVSCAPLELNGARIGSVFTFRDITERKRAERALRQSDERFRRLFEADIIGIMVSDREHILEANDQFLRMLGYTREAFKPGEISWRAITPAEYIEVSERGRYLLSTTGVCPAIEKEYIRRDGSRVPVLLAAVELNRTAEQLLCFALDLTDRKSLENQFRQSQKLESVGLLAGGVAHDFNNLLTIIMGYARMVRDQVHRQHPMRDALDQISAAADRAAGLTRQLLTFSRRNTSVPKILNLDSLVRDIEKMLRRLIGEHIEVILATAADAGFVHADPGLIEQVIVNLVVNARDAMPNGGKLFIETSRIAVADDFAALAFSIPRGTYISLGVTDTGTGMTPEVQSRLFEPFFTTKEPGKGTGLGLSTVYGIVKQSGGSITVHSTLGIGTSVRVLFPAVDGGTYVPEQTENTGKSVRGTETVLLVEDEPGVRNYIREVLDTHGYRTLDTSRGPEAIELARHYGGPIHLLLTDMVLPGMNGSEVIRQFLAVRPGVPVIRMSGYSERLGAQLDDSVPLLQKPFTPRVLLYRIRDMLDGG